MALTESPAQQLVKLGHYMTLTYTGPCSFGDHVDFECTCGKKNEVYGSATDVVEHTLELALEYRERLIFSNDGLDNTESNMG